MTKQTIQQTDGLPILLIIWMLSSWWVLFPILSLGLFMVEFDQVVSALGFVGFRDVSVIMRWLSAVIDRRLHFESVLMSFRFEDVIFYLCLAYVSFSSAQSHWIKRMGIVVLCAHIFMQACLVVSLDYALQASNINLILQVIQWGGILISALAVLQIIMIFITGITLLFYLNAPGLHQG